MRCCLKFHLNFLLLVYFSPYASQDKERYYQHQREYAARKHSLLKIVVRALGNIAHQSGAEGAAKIARHSQKCKHSCSARGDITDVDT